MIIYNSLQQPVTQMRADKARAACHENISLCHILIFPVFDYKYGKIFADQLVKLGFADEKCPEGCRSKNIATASSPLKVFF